jgi:diadenosine tetraphosphatase ApaH/serine/threonine PP2A family protein phosphatase
MRIAIFTDIHANREAFSACLLHAERTGYDRVVFLGDYVGYGADPGWVVDIVEEQCRRGAIALLGNHDQAVLLDSSGMNEQAAQAVVWTRGHLSDSQKKFLSRLPMTIADGNRLYVHASAHAPQEWDYVTDMHSASQSFAATHAHVTFCGHVHAPRLYHTSATGKLASFDPIERIPISLSAHRRWLAVIGSVGQPRDHNPAACYAVFDDARDELTYYRVPYDVNAAAKKIEKAELPVWLAQRLYSGD